MRVQETEAGFGDMSDTITHVCICGSQFFNLQVAFEDYEISAYLLDMTCAVCGTAWTAPTECDRP
jgi:hypothetical protein